MQYVAGGVGVNQAQVGEAIVAARKLDGLDQVILAEPSSMSARTPSVGCLASVRGRRGRLGSGFE